MNQDSSIFIEISANLAPRIGKIIADLGFEGKNILLVSDEDIYSNSSRFFGDNLDVIISRKLILINPKADEISLEKIREAATNCDLILALGGGTINDLCKITSAQSKTPYAIVASAASMNGYLSKNASITIAGHKKTIPATLPIAVFCDLEILKSAPLRLTKAGIGDSLCFNSCWFDWYLSQQIIGTEFDIKPFEILRDKMSFLIENFKNFSIQDDGFITLLIEILLLSGQGMTMAGGSYPASQSEHLIAHTIDMKYPELSTTNLHGQVIAVTSLTSARIQKDILESDFSLLSEQIRENFSKNDYFEQIKGFFGEKIALECQKEYKNKVLEIKNAINEDFSVKSTINSELNKIYLDEHKLREIFYHFEINVTPESIGLSRDEYNDCVKQAKFIRNRFTCLDLV